MNKSEKAGPTLIRIAKALLFCVLAAVLFGVPLFLSAGSLRFTGAWLFLGIFCISVLVIFTYLAVKDPDLFEKRMKMEEEERVSDVNQAFADVDLPRHACRFWSRLSIPLVKGSIGRACLVHACGCSRCRHAVHRDETEHFWITRSRNPRESEGDRYWIVLCRSAPHVFGVFHHLLLFAFRSGVFLCSRPGDVHALPDCDEDKERGTATSQGLGRVRLIHGEGTIQTDTVCLVEGYRIRAATMMPATNARTHHE